METEQLKEKAEDLTSHIGEMADTFYKLTTVKLAKQATSIASNAISIVVVCMLGLFIVFFGGMGLAWYLGDVMESRAAGFAVVGGFFLLVLIVVLAVRRKLIFPYLRNAIIRRIYD